MPDGGHRGRHGQDVAPVHRRSRRTRFHGDHRRVERLHTAAYRRPATSTTDAASVRRPLGVRIPRRLLPGVHRIAALAKRWLLGTHQGAADRQHLPGYLNEFVFRFNRRTSRNRGLVFMRLLQLAVGHDPVRYRELIRRPRPRETSPVPPGATGTPAQPRTPPPEQALAPP